MSQRARFTLNLTVEDAGRPLAVFESDRAWSNSSVKQEVVTCATGAFTALSPPAGASAVIIDLGFAPSLTLKGVTGDGGGLSLTPATAVVGLPIVLPLGAAPTLGILNGDTVTHHVPVLWLVAGTTVYPD